MVEQVERMYLAHMRSELRGADSSIAALRAGACDASGTHREELLRAVDSLAERAREARARLVALERTEPERWEEAKGDLVDAWTRLREEYRAAESLVSQRTES